ncbi:EI24 domain-containing protein [Microbacterium halotolerans]|uniref:EI24 domain-containing protein n=1 Tax=Microbacterium halotolerans TaxID=246613 RepID=UPI000E6AA10F|nr:EI24 domain-containing protein [Microbacterium halotolerans]
MRGFWRGVRTLFDGFGWWRQAPGAMALGLVPAVIVAALATAAIVTLAAFAPALVSALTPFADGWHPFWAGALRVAIGLALVAGTAVAAAVTFTAVTLAVGEPFYERIWRSVESAAGEAPDARYGFWRAAGDGLSLILRGLLVAVAVGLIGLIPFVGTVLGAVTGAVLSGLLLTDELASRALTARGLNRRERRRLLRTQRSTALGFGVATYLCFLIPLGAVLVMPAAVAGSTLLSQRLLHSTGDSEVSASPRPPRQEPPSQASRPVRSDRGSNGPCPSSGRPD